MADLHLPLFPDFSRRSSLRELMDDEEIADGEMSRTLDELAAINRWLGGYAASICGLRRLLPPPPVEISLLDVGCGGGDVLGYMVEWGRARGIEIRGTGVDRSSSAIAYARERRGGGANGLRFEAVDFLELDGAQRFDIVHSSLVLHHFPGAEAAQALRKMYDLARWGVVINDLHRHPLAYYSIRVLTRILSRSRLIQNDAPVSVLRGFSAGDWGGLVALAGLPAPELRWRWPFRWQVVMERRVGCSRTG